MGHLSWWKNRMSILCPRTISVDQLSGTRPSDEVGGALKSILTGDSNSLKDVVLFLVLPPRAVSSSFSLPLAGVLALYRDSSMGV
ncbi:MAG: hypothetical protein Q8904_14735 [Bacteroidota bacterium]|nr:hypothetical protein [Bacteroidota bacterium]